MAVTGAHVLLYTPEADAVRAVLRDVFGFGHVDAGDGWLIFALPPAEVAVHPADGPRHELTFMCDDLEATVAELEAKGVEVRPERQTAGWGVQATIVLPGGVDVMLYQPRHSTAI
jgi:catechol 2,3-dioxygenase-like lactoylglutathione lyase family enzyme